MTPPRAATDGDAGATCKCGHPEHHCLAGHHHVVASLAAECTAKLEAATRPRVA